MRTVKQNTYDLNKGKLADIHVLCRAYACEKNHWLTVFKSIENLKRIKQHRQVRNEAIADKYISPNGMQARMWKLALIDAAETMDKYWQAIFIAVRESIAKNKSLDVVEIDNSQVGNKTKDSATHKIKNAGHKPKKQKESEHRHYLYWLLCDYQRFFSALHGEIPLPEKFTVEKPKQLIRYLQKTVKKHRGKLPVVKKSRSFCLDSDCYTVFSNNNTNYIKVMSLQKGKRIVIPLSGNTAISGTVRVVADKNTVRIHESQKIKVSPCFTKGSNEIAAIDIGYTEVAVDESGNVYGAEFGAFLTEISDRRNRKGKNRNKLYALEKKYRAAGNFKKADNIKRFNLGKQKQEKILFKEQQQLKNCINHGINGLLRERQPEILVTEHLRNSFTFNKPKTVNRKLSSWVKGVVQDRISFKSRVKGFHHEQVNPAYSSQTCPVCGYVDKNNRKQNLFKCLSPRCGYVNHADRVGAINIKSRRTDPDIGIYTPYKKVKAILLDRYSRRLEADDAVLSKVTVPGRTLEAVRTKTTNRSRGKGAAQPLSPCQV